eukprot:CAMPEP_0119039936 /NCGR_PEP_ID=MMETSP1177-20130426/9722_1 /TAXON_ID=2985 /ORGANISM="Ochromonas sp, Strain CCMP1899" /LENGTH=270 /DNA_ID=CAMNT_0007004489 /DNA_START=316 /DNA_END=1128 /DNA_ORIENTATION=+
MDKNHTADDEEKTVAFCVMAKNELDLHEWVDYHRKLDVTKFYVFDDYSSPPLSTSIAEFIESGLVEYQTISFYWTNTLHFLGIHTKNHDRSAFDRCLKTHGHKHMWIGFLDSDEYIILKDEFQQSLPDFLENFEMYGGLVLNWMSFGSSGHIQRPKGGILKNYYRCNPEGTVKTIVQPKYTIGTGVNCHYFTYKGAHYAVNEDGVRVDGHWSHPVAMSKIYINHYRLKSLEDFNLKRARWSNSPGKDLRPELFQEVDTMMSQNCSIPIIL